MAEHLVKRTRALLVVKPRFEDAGGFRTAAFYIRYAVKTLSNYDLGE